MENCFLSFGRLKDITAPLKDDSDTDIIEFLSNEVCINAEKIVDIYNLDSSRFRYC